MTKIASTAMVAKTAQLGEDVTIGPGCVIGSNVIIENGCELRANVYITRDTILGKNNLPYCERMVDSCDYDCPDWEIGSVYEVNGIFFAEPPPRGTALSLFFDYYFQVENARVVEGTNIGERAGRLFSAIKDLVTSSFGRDETYVLMD